MYPATSDKVSICITGQSGATYEYESSIFNEVHVFAFFKSSQHVELKITTCSMHMNISLYFIIGKRCLRLRLQRQISSCSVPFCAVLSNNC